MLIGQSVNNIVVKKSSKTKNVFMSENKFQNLATLEDVIQSAETVFEATELPEPNPFAEVCFNRERRRKENRALTLRTSFLLSNGNSIFHSYAIELNRNCYLKTEDPRLWANTFSAESIHIILDKILSLEESHSVNLAMDKNGFHSFLRSEEVTGLSSFKELWRNKKIGANMLTQEELV